MTDSVQRIKFPEFIFGFVAPIGVDLSSTLAAYRTYFVQRDYRVVEVKVTDVFNIFEKYITPNEPLVRSGSLYARYKTHIAYGNQLRAKFSNEILAATAIRRVMKDRLKFQKVTPTALKFSKVVYLLHQFKRKEEIDLLRAVYGRIFFQVSIYSRRGARVDYLSRKFASSDHSSGPQKYRNIAESLIQTDENETESLHGQRVAQIFHDADLIASLDAAETIDAQIHRFCELLFGSNSISPTRREYGLFLAKAAALRTLDLSRQVGAAVFSNSGEILALGSNEVPKAGGGSYWAEGSFDDRDFKRQMDSNIQRKRDILGELVKIIDPSKDLDKLLDDPKIRESQFMDALEYGRIVHAEMAALSDAARLGHQVKDGTLYCTTFPCHMCAKHIVAAGLAKVIFLEPYPKSLAYDLHSDSISVEGGDRGAYNKFPSVEFEHFYGVSPRRYREIFERAKRKDDHGNFLPYGKDGPRPIINLNFPFYAQLEEHLTEGISKDIIDAIDST